MDSPQQCVPTHWFLRLEPSIVQATSFHQQLPLWMCLPLTHPSSLFSLRRDFSPPPDFRTVRNCPEPLSMRRRTAFLPQGCRILYIVGVCVNRIGTDDRIVAQMLILQLRHDPSDLIVERRNHAHVGLPVLVGNGRVEVPVFLRDLIRRV